MEKGSPFLPVAEAKHGDGRAKIGGGEGGGRGGKAEYWGGLDTTLRRSRSIIGLGRAGGRDTPRVMG